MGRKGTRLKGSRIGKKMLTAKEICAGLGENPVDNLIRLAYLMEDKEEYVGASSNWKTIQEYIWAKVKAIDTAEVAAGKQAQVTLDDIAKMKQAILDGANKLIEHSPDMKIIDVQLTTDKVPNQFI